MTIIITKPFVYDLLSNLKSMVYRLKVRLNLNLTDSILMVLRLVVTCDFFLLKLNDPVLYVTYILENI